EQLLAKSEECSLKSDLWAVGAILHWALTGKPVREQPDLLLAVKETTEAWAKGTLELPSLEAIRHQLPEGVHALIAKALSILPTQRFENARQMLDQVEILRKTSFSWSFRGAECPNCATPTVSGQTHACSVADGQDLFCLRCSAAECSQSFLALRERRPPLRV